MLMRLAAWFLPLGRSLARRMPRLAHSAFGRAAKAAVRELVYPTSQVAWRRSLPQPEITPRVADNEPSKEGKPYKKVKSPNTLAEFTSAFIGTNRNRTCDVVLCCAFTGRHHVVSRIVEESLADGKPDVRWMLTGSSEEDEEFIQTLSTQDNRVVGFRCKNRPLGRKWQTCVHKAASYFDSALYCIVGSDDFISKKLLNSIAERHRRNLEFSDGAEFMPAMYCALEWLVYHVDTRANLSPNIMKCSYEFKTAFQPLGAGRFYTREFLQTCNGLIFDSTLDRLLDDRGFQQVLDQAKPVEYYSLEDGPLVSVKGDWSQLNSFNNFLSARTLILEEFSFEGYAMLQEALSPTSMNFLSKPTRIDPQFNFAELNTGLGPDSG